MEQSNTKKINTQKNQTNIQKKNLRAKPKDDNENLILKTREKYKNYV
jgi:uncharacterized lipoprotein YehR (DUF1307 family)